jgi:group I intron endonuclease
VSLKRVAADKVLGLFLWGGDDVTQGIYGIYNSISLKWYVGQSANIERRWGSHRYKLSAADKSCNPHFQAAWSKYGEAAFTLIVLEVVLDATLLTEKEEFWITEKLTTSCGVYNKRAASVSNLGTKFSAESRARMSVGQKGRRHSPEAIKKSADSRRGKKRSLVTREKMSIAKKGKCMSELSAKHCAEMAAANRLFDEEAALKIRSLCAQGYTRVSVAAIMKCSVKTICTVLNGRHGYAPAPEVVNNG